MAVTALRCPGRLPAAQVMTGCERLSRLPFRSLCAVNTVQLSLHCLARKCTRVPSCSVQLGPLASSGVHDCNLPSQQEYAGVPVLAAHMSDVGVMCRAAVALDLHVWRADRQALATRNMRACVRASERANRLRADGFAATCCRKSEARRLRSKRTRGRPSPLGAMGACITARSAGRGARRALRAAGEAGAHTSC